MIAEVSRGSPTLPPASSHGPADSSSDSACFGCLPAPELEGQRLATKLAAAEQSHADQTESTRSQVCLPTAARERQKAKEKAAKESGNTEKPKKKKHIVEAHYDDCGDSLDGLNLLCFTAADQQTYEYMIDSDGCDDDNFDLDEHIEPCMLQ